MLRLQDQDPSYLEPSGDDCGAAAPPAPGAQIGPYTLIRKIGEGGMGTVFLAEQRQPVKRTVAIKIIKPGMDSRRVIARFEAERRALAIMDHPHIAKVLDAGTIEGDRENGRQGDNETGRQREPAAPNDSRRPVSLSPRLPVPLSSSGRPYFVMELVDGVPITKYCDEHRLTPQERLELFIPVCQAVQHAHQKGIIHRDLKPSNVLIALYDGKPVPKIIDFGVAKAVGSALTEWTELTEFGSVIGTLEYMSPEQAEPGQTDIDTRSDIYSLGALLYELLTGTTPLQPRRLHGAALLELLRIVREEEPPTPSSRLSTTEELPSIAANRHLEPKKLSGLVRGDLDWIVMKCLEKNRTRRYETANGLARDLERYLHDEPVEARSPTAGYRLRKFTHRHKKILATGMAFLLLLIAGTAVSAWQAVRATVERDAKEEARQAEASERRKAVEEKQRADAQAAIAKAVNEFLQKDLLGQADIGNQDAGADRNRNITVRELLDRAARGIGQKFTGQEQTEAAIRLTLGRAYLALGEYPAAQEQLQRSLDLRKEKLGATHLDTLKAMHSLGVVYLERHKNDEAKLLLQEALAGFSSKLGGSQIEAFITMQDFARAYHHLGRLEEAENLYKKALAGLQSLLGHDHRVALITMGYLAGLYQARGQYEQSTEQLLHGCLGSPQGQTGRRPPRHHSSDREPRQSRARSWPL